MPDEDNEGRCKTGLINDDGDPAAGHCSRSVPRDRSGCSNSVPRDRILNTSDMVGSVQDQSRGTGCSNSVPVGQNLNTLSRGTDPEHSPPSVSRGRDLEQCPP